MTSQMKKWEIVAGGILTKVVAVSTELRGEVDHRRRDGRGVRE
jgi:hypothetical protein